MFPLLLRSPIAARACKVPCKEQETNATLNNATMGKENDR
jgi:hypothetical protein